MKNIQCEYRISLKSNPLNIVPQRLIWEASAEKSKTQEIPQDIGSLVEILAGNKKALTATRESVISTLSYKLSDGKSGRLFSPELLKILAKRPEKEIRAGVAKNKNTPIETLQVLAIDPEINVRSAILANSSRKPGMDDIIIKIVPHASLQMRDFFVRHRLPFPAKVEMKFAIDENIDVRILLAKNTQNDPILKILANDQRHEVRDIAAQNKFTSPETLDILYRNGNHWTKINIARNKNTSSTTLNKISLESDTNNGVYLFDLLQNPSTPEEARERVMNTLENILSRAPGDTTRERLLQYIYQSFLMDPSTPATIKERIGKIVAWKDGETIAEQQ